MTQNSTPLRETEKRSAPAAEPNRTPIIIVLLMGAFLPPLDFYIVNLALPAIREGLQATGGQLQLIVSCYASAYAVFLVTGGRLGDLYGRKQMFMAGVARFHYRFGHLRVGAERIDPDTGPGFTGCFCGGNGSASVGYNSDHFFCWRAAAGDWPVWLRVRPRIDRRPGSWRSTNYVASAGIQLAKHFPD